MIEREKEAVEAGREGVGEEGEEREGGRGQQMQLAKWPPFDELQN